MNKFVGLLVVIGLAAVVYVNWDKLAALRGGAAAAQAEQGEQPGIGNTERVLSAAGEPSSPSSPPAAGAPEQSVPAMPTAAATPHPALEAQAQASRIYPGLLIPSSPLNKRFIALHTDAKLTDPQLLTRPDWPLTLAERAMRDIGGVPLARMTPAPIMTPKPLPGSALDARPKK